MKRVVEGSSRGPRRRLPAAAVCWAALLAGCEAPAERGRGSADASAAADPTPTRAAPAPAPRTSPASAPRFDPGAIQPGDTVAGLVVDSKEVSRVFGDSAWVGTVVFDGEVELTGVYQSHFDWPEPRAACFHVAASSRSRIPRFEPDAWTSPDAKTWFCFTDTERAIQLLGAPDTPRVATVVVRRYRVERHFTDAYDTAELVRVTRLGPTASRSLRGMTPDPEDVP